MKYVYIEARRDMRFRGKKYKLYHVSPADRPLLTGQLIPRVPKNWMTEQGYEDNTTPRISFAPSIGKCLSAVSGLRSGSKLHVYALDYLPKGYKPSAKQVPDVAITQEYWVTEPVSPVYLGTIKITSEKPNTLEEMSEALDLEDSPDWFPHDITEKEFIDRFYSKNRQKGKAIYKLYTGDKKKAMEYQLGDRTRYSGDYGWRWIKRAKTS